MGYRIEYGPSIKEKPSRTGWFTALFFLFFCLMVVCFWPEGKALMEELLLPGENAVTREAAEVFIRELRFGEPFSEAAEHFCRGILSHEGFG